MEISRSYVSQLLSFARETGIVKISINIDEFSSRMIRKEFEFKSKFPKLKQVYIMHSDSLDYTEKNIGKFAAPYVAQMINEANIIGVNLGLSVERTIENLDPFTIENGSVKKVVQIMGGLDSTEINFSHPSEVVKKLGDILNCKCYYLNCPAIIEQKELRKNLIKEKSIQKVMHIWDRIDLAIMGIGVANECSKLFSLFNDEIKYKIKSSNTCGELNINFFDIEGNYLPLIEEKSISIPFSELKKIKRKVAICFGEHKKAAITGALRTGMIDVLITDLLTAQCVEDYIKELDK